MATYSYKHAVKMGGKIIPANTEIKEPVKTTKKTKTKSVEPETAADDTAKAE